MGVSGLLLGNIPLYFVASSVIQQCRTSLQVVNVRLPGRDGIRLVETADVGERLPESLQVGLAVHLLGP
jgi:hypothetical protein